MAKEKIVLLLPSEYGNALAAISATNPDPKVWLQYDWNAVVVTRCMDDVGQPEIIFLIGPAAGEFPMPVRKVVDHVRDVADMVNDFIQHGVKQDLTPEVYLEATGKRIYTLHDRVDEALMDKILTAVPEGFFSESRIGKPILVARPVMDDELCAMPAQSLRRDH